MRLNAYVLAGDPAWAATSLRSYYHLVDRVVVSFDQDHRSWAGLQLSTGEALSQLRRADTQGKLVMLPGHHSDGSRDVLQVETEQRQSALDAASEGADWVLQLDTDEVVLAPELLREHVVRAADRGVQAMDFPLRDFYQALPADRFLEHCGRFWTPQAAFPGPVAVRAGTRLDHCRQARVPLYRVDLTWHNTDPWHPRTARVHAVVAPGEAIAHLSWVRTPVHMTAKAQTSGYANSGRWGTALSRWAWRAQHPWLTAARAPFARDPLDRFRVSTLTLPGAMFDAAEGQEHP